jgi:predicted transcriptional regulator
MTGKARVMGKTKKVQVTFTYEQWELIENLKEQLGKGDADVVRNIVLAWLAEKSILSESAKKKMEGEK